MKKFYFLTLALICAFVANADTFTAGTKFYLNPSIQWSEANARFALHVAADNTGATVAWVDMTDEDGDGVYEAEAPEGNWTIVDFCRMNPATTENNWDNKWDDTGYTVYAGNNCCVVTGWGSYAWGTSPYWEKIYMTGYNGTWSASEPFEISGENGVYTAKAVEFTNAEKTFKLSTAKGVWDNNETKVGFNDNGLNVGTVTVGTEATVTRAWGENNTIENGTYDITIDLVNKTFLATASVPTAIESVEAASAVVEYYNLQGVKVENPEKGVFIKKQGGKTTKVVL